MARAYSQDLGAGMSAGQAAERFGIGVGRRSCGFVGPMKASGALVSRVSRSARAAP